MAEPKPNEADTRSPADPGRRGALRSLVTAGTVVYAGVVAVPAAGFLAATGETKAGGQRWLRVAALADLPEGEPRRVKVVGDERDAFTVTRDQQLGAVLLVRKGDK